MTRPMLVSENSRSALMPSIGQPPPNKLPQYVAAFVSTLSAVSLGMVFSWTSSALLVMEDKLHIITADQGSWIGSLVLLGACVGAIPGGHLTHFFGRKRSLLILIVPLFLSWIIIAFAYKQVAVVYFARFLAGLSGGAISVAAPMYVAELSHISIRGSLGTFFQVQITVGILLSYLLGAIVDDILTLSLISSVLPVVFLLGFAFVPESPVYQCEKGDMEEAKKSLVWFRGPDYEVEDELVKISEDIKESQRNKMKLSDLFKCKATYKGLIISFGLMTFQQLSGVNAVLFYASKIFMESKAPISPRASSIIIGVVQVIATLGSTVLIEKTGRKILLIVSDFVMCISLAAIGFYFYFNEGKTTTPYTYIPLAGVALFIIFFSIGLGPIPWLIMSEIFPSNAKGIASSLSASLNWFLAFLVTNRFASMVEVLTIGPTFLVFSVICGIGTTFITLMVPETKGRTIEEISDILTGRSMEPIIYNDEKPEKMTTLV